MVLRMKLQIFVLAAEIPCEWMFATKFASDCRMRWRGALRREGIRLWANGFVRKWGRTDLTGFYFFIPVGVRLVPLKHMISRGFDRILSGI